MAASDAPTRPGLFVKTAGASGQAARLRREAELLAIAQGAGVVSLVGEEGTATEPVLVTARVEGPDLGRAPELAVEEVAGLVAALGESLADVHDLGVVHGAVVAEHVLLAPDGRPILCGFGYGGRTGEPPVAEAALPEPAVDPARAPGGPLSCASDVLALGALLDGLLVTAKRTGSSEAEVDALRAVAARTAVADPDLRPSARAVAEAVRHAVPSARLPGPRRLRAATDRTEAPDDGQALRALRGQGGAGGLPSGRGHRSMKALPAALAAVALTVVVVVWIMVDSTARPDPPGRRLPAPSPPAPDTVAPSTDASAPSTTPGSPATACPAVPGLFAADTDGDHCPESLRWEGGVVEGGDRRWSVGQPGDVAVTGDWTCSGRATLAVLRPSTGQVFVFHGWATGGQDLTAPETTRMDGAFALRVAELDGDGCADLVVERAGGPPAAVPLPAHRP